MDNTDWVAPVITGILAVILSIVSALLARRGARVGSQEGRAPNVQDMWAQQEADRRMRQVVEDLWWQVRRAFQSYYRRVTSAIMKLGLPEEKIKVFELTASELKAIEATVPDEPDES